jgi:hypothetical protein
MNPFFLLSLGGPNQIIEFLEIRRA